MRKCWSQCAWVLTLLGSLYGLGPARAEKQFATIQGVNGASYQAWVERVTRDGYRPVFVNAFAAGKVTQFAALAVRDGKKVAWVARHDLTSARYQQAFARWTGKGYRLLCVTGYPGSGGTRFAAVWARDGRGGPGAARHDLTAREYQGAVAEFKTRGLQPVHVSGYPVGNSARFAAVFAGSLAPWQAWHDLSAEQFQQTCERWRARGYSPLSIAAYPSGGTLRFALVLVCDFWVGDWKAPHGLSAGQYRQQSQRWLVQGYRPVAVCGYLADGPRYAAVWVKQRSAAMPVSGQAVPALAAFDRAMQKFMRQRHIPAGTLAVMRHGRLLLSRGYGFADRAGSRVVAPDALMRIASVSKPITAAAVRRLIRAGKLTRGTRVFPLLGVTPPRGQQADPRLKDITVQHLLEHRGGWDRDKAFDPMFRSTAIAAALGKPGPASSHDIIKYMAGQKLQFTPGSKTVYSNFGYCVLGRVIEKVTGQTYLAHVRQAVLAPLGAKDVAVGHTLPRQRSPREPFYSDPGMGNSVFQPKSLVPVPDGAFYLEAMDAHGGLIAASGDLVRFMAAYWLDGNPRLPKTSGRFCFFGRLPGTFAMALQRPDGTDVAVLFNQSQDASGLAYDDIEKVMNETAEGVKRWPE